MLNKRKPRTCGAAYTLQQGYANHFMLLQAKALLVSDEEKVAKSGTEKFTLQKRNSMHYNPCVERWRLCEHTYQYPHSSAAFYEHGRPTNNLLKDYRAFLLLLMPQWEEEEQRPQTR